MTEQVKQALFAKNTRIIEAVKARAQRLCPNALDMIAVTGSFATGDYHEKSDLDLLIVIGDASGYALSHCFILDDVGYDLYCHTWERLEDAAKYESPYVSKLLDAQIVYCRDEAVRARFTGIAERLKARLEAPLSPQDISCALGEVLRAKQAYFDLAACEGVRYHYPLMQLIYRLECAVYLMNHAVVRHGVRGIPTELAAMPSLPDGFLTLHGALFDPSPYESHLRCAMSLIRSTERWVLACREVLCPREQPSEDSLRGTYEELVSNYRNKLIQAARNGERYLSQMTLGASELFFAEVGQALNIAVPASPDNAAYDDPTAAAEAFALAMEQYAAVYASVGLQVCRYAELCAFEENYIPCKDRDKDTKN